MKTLKWFGIMAMVAVSAFLIGTAVSSAFAQGGGPWGNWGRGGMMGGFSGRQTGTYGPGMMGGYSGGNVNPNATPITLDKAEGIAKQYAQSLGANLKVAEVMQFDNGFYAEIVESDTGIGAQEILIDLYTGAACPEFGPNMMWNTKYGHMGGGQGGMMGRFFNQQPSDKLTVTPEQARQDAQAYLDQAQPGLKVGDDIVQFYGYYTLHTFKDSKEFGMLSVNGYSGQVWYHTWHGAFVTTNGN